MKKLLLLFVFVGCHTMFSKAQNGHYFLSHYKPGNDNIGYLSFDIHEDNHGILYFANRSGVLQFDGRTWTMVPVVGVYSLAVNASGDVFAAGSSGFGRIGLNAANHLSYISLSDSLPKSKNIFASLSQDSSIYFLNEYHLFEYRTGSGKARSVFTAEESQGAFTGLLLIGTGLYVNTEKDGLKKMEGETLQPSGIPEIHRQQLIFSERSPDGNSDLIANEYNRFFLLKKGQGIRAFKPADSLYLAANVVANGSWVTDKMLAIGTLRGGIVFVDSETGETLEILNYQAGLPDNEVYALHTDHDHGLWVAHDYGFTRVAPFLPFRTFNHYGGLAGNLRCVQTFAGQVYVGTTLGLFRLTREEIFEDETYTVTKTTLVKSENIPVTITGEVTQTPERKKKIRLGFLSGLKKKKAEPPPAPAVVMPSATKSVKTQVQKTRKVLKGIQYLYKPVDGISGKVDELLLVGTKLLSGGVGGVFDINGLQAVPVTRDPSRAIFYSRNLKQLLISTYDDEIKSFQLNPKGWQPADFLDTLSAYADYFFEDNLQNLWICERDRVVKVGVEGGEILDAESIALPHASVDRAVGLAFGQEVYITQNGEFYHYASFKNQLVKYDSFPGPKKYFASAGYFWFYDGHKWRTFDKKLQGTIRTEWLSVFPDVRFLGPSEQGKSLWVITAANELYKFSSDQGKVPESNPLFLKEVRSQEQKLSPSHTLLVEEDKSALTFEFMQPEYISLQAVEYRYWVQGIQKDWTDWSTFNNVINFTFLPPGKYHVQIESRDLFGKVSKLDTISFNVVPPYWKRPWFYALEFLVFGSLVVLSLRIHTLNTRYRYLSRFLSALTMVLLIQFIQTIATANISLKSTPVADFFIQVVIALLVLPAEEFLRGRIVNAGSEKLKGT